jgi:hypothetical protein
VTDYIGREDCGCYEKRSVRIGVNTKTIFWLKTSFFEI